MSSLSMTSPQSQPPVTLRALSVPDEDVLLCFGIRRRVFIDEQGVPEEVEMDANDRTATHVLATSEGKAVGAARIVVLHIQEGGEMGDGVRVGKIGRVCVVPEMRGRGFGRSLVRFAVDELRKTLGEGGTAMLGAQVHAMGFYEGMGFEAIPGDEYMDAGGVPHRDMELTL